MPIKRVWIEPGCIRCNLSEDTCPEVFHVLDDGATVRPGADLVKNEALIRRAADTCPVEVIKFEEG
jgi:ferredoxin